MNYMPANIAENFFLQPITAHEIKFKILKLTPRKSPGDDNIGANIYQICPDVFAENLAKIYNNSITKGNYPDQMKIAKVVALFKKGENSYQKTIDQLVYHQCLIKFKKKNLCKQLVSFIELNKMLYNYQFGSKTHYH